jgi:hypothetical protein
MAMILIYALIVILGEAVTEGLLKRFNKAEWLFGGFIQWLIAIFLFGVWFVVAYHFDNYYVETWKLILGFIFVRFGIFDIAWNLARGVKWNYYGTTKLYDRIMFKLGSWGWFMKLVLLIVGVCFLIGIE